jgi:hypothetical protein
MTNLSPARPGPSSEDEIEPQILSLRVINFNSFAIHDRFDGTVFRFESNMPKDIPIDAAHHIFGWFPPFIDKDGQRREVDPEIMRAHCQRRFGWNTPKMVESGAADEFFHKLQFRPIMFRMVPVPVDEEEPAKEPIVRGAKVNRTMAAADEAAKRT